MSPWRGSAPVLLRPPVSPHPVPLLAAWSLQLWSSMARTLHDVGQGAAKTSATWSEKAATSEAAFCRRILFGAAGPHEKKLIKQIASTRLPRPRPAGWPRAGRTRGRAVPRVRVPQPRQERGSPSGDAPRPPRRSLHGADQSRVGRDCRGTRGRRGVIIVESTGARPSALAQATYAPVGGARFPLSVLGHHQSHGARLRLREGMLGHWPQF